MWSALRNRIRVPWYTYQRMISSTTRVIRTGNLPAVAYKPEIVENKYEDWKNSGLYKAQNDSSKPVFSMVLPPPNVTGKLHLGHALACTIQDVIVRRKRSMGFNVLWLPGTDHAGIATQGVVERYLKSKLGIDRHSLTRDAFNREVWKWQAEHGDTITKQLQKLGCSLDWSRETFTMNPKHTHAVNTAFIQLFKKGLIYRKKALVNWCNAMKSTVSDIEVENRVVDGPTDLYLDGYEKPVKFGFLYKFAYKIEGTDDEILVATTLPETMLGDVAIAVHPDDSRYSHLKDMRVVHPFTKETIPIIFDEFVDMSFGTGAVKITPAHSKIDYEIAKDHKLPMKQVIDEKGLMVNSFQFNNMQQYEARVAVVDELRKLDLMKGTEPHSMSLPVCSRSGDIITHLPKEQWFLSCNKLNERAIQLVESGKLDIKPAKYVKNWLSWTGDDRDWCISRQLWWGHQIPAYKCINSLYPELCVWVAANDEEAAKIAASSHLKAPTENIEATRDTDVLDTWFSSGIYPFASLGWPDEIEGKDYKDFYPLSLMATGHDIIGFWVHRMVILGLELTEKLPFKNVLLHGIICDSKGAKMSKSKGNVIDPMDVINGITLDELNKKTVNMRKMDILSKTEAQRALEYQKANFSNTNGIPSCGVDALRFTLLSADVKSNFVHFDPQMCFANKLFCNKIWQSIKYMQLSFDKLKSTQRGIAVEDLTYFDIWILSRLADMVEKVNEFVDNYDFHLATKALRTLIYHEFCDVYLEATKPGFEAKEPTIGYAHAHTLSAVLNTSLRCLHPFMIYLTDEVIPKIPNFEKNVIINFDDYNKPYYDFPQYEKYKGWKKDGFEKNVDKVINTISLVRELKGLYGISNKIRPMLTVNTKNEILKADLLENKNVVLNLTRCSDMRFDESSTSKQARGYLDSDTEIAVELIGEDIESLIAQARTRLQTKIKKIEDILSKSNQDNTNILLKKEELKKLHRLIL